MPKQPSHFFALRPTPGAVAEMAELRDRPGLGGFPVKDEHLHVTLFWLGYDHPGTPALVDRARDAADTVAAPPLRVVFDRLVAGKDSVLLPPTEPLDHLRAFQRCLATALARHDVCAGPGWRFHPHATLRRRSSGGVAGLVLPIAWTAIEFALFRNRPDPFRHETVGVWPLARRPATARPVGQSSSKGQRAQSGASNRQIA